LNSELKILNSESQIIKKTHAAGFSEASENTIKVADSRCNLLVGVNSSFRRIGTQPAIACLRLP
jgi:hypothetical protein